MPSDPSDAVLVHIACAGEKAGDGLAVCRLDPREGSLSAPACAEPNIARAFFLTPHPSAPLLYATVQDAKGDWALVALAVDPHSGALTERGRQPTGGNVACHAALDPTGRCALIAHYVDGTVAALPLDEEGRPQPGAGPIAHRGSGPHPKRQEGPHVHCALPSPDGRYAFAADLGTDRVEAYALDAPSASLRHDSPRSVTVHGGAGPRHLLFAPSGRVAYLLNELDSTLMRFDYDPSGARLSARQTLSTLPADCADESYAADLILHPEGRLLMTTNRGHDSIALFRVEEASGALTPLGHASSRGHYPWNLALAHGGRHLLVTNTKENNAAVFRVDAEGEALTPVGEPVALPSPMCVHASQ